MTPSEELQLIQGTTKAIKALNASIQAIKASIDATNALVKANGERLDSFEERVFGIAAPPEPQATEGAARLSDLDGAHDFVHSANPPDADCPQCEKGVELDGEIWFACATCDYGMVSWHGARCLLCQYVSRTFGR